MIFHYAGKYNGDESSLPYKEHHPNAIPFKEPKDIFAYCKFRMRFDNDCISNSLFDSGNKIYS